MRVIDTKQFAVNRQRLAAKKKRVRREFLAVVLIVLLTGYSYLSYQRPLPEAPVVIQAFNSSAPTAPKLSWPSYGQAAVGTQAYGLLKSNGEQAPIPTASVAKVMTALAVLKKMPLKSGEQGPTLTLGDADVAAYDFFAANGGSLVAVMTGEQISQYQALQALLLPSANNMAESLARWAFGSLEAYTTYANKLAKELRMTKTTIADASGFSAQTISTADDLVRLGLAAMQNPVLAEIVGQSEATIPVAGQIQSTNRLLGQKDIVGIKTGNTDEAGGCYLFATTHTFEGGRKMTLIGAIMAAPSLTVAMNDSVPLMDSVYNSFKSFKVLSKGQTIGSYKFAWGETNEAVAADDIYIFAWQDELIDPIVSVDPLSSAAKSGSSIGTVSVVAKLEQKNISATVKSQVKAPNLWWRLKHN